jgi:two-component system, sensor histidine kinase and response regulator
MKPAESFNKPWLRVAAAWLLPFGVCLLQLLLWPYVSPSRWFLFYPVILFAPWIGGLIGGLGATALSALLVWYFFLPPQQSWAVVEWSSLVSTSVFLICGIAFSLFYERVRERDEKYRTLFAQAGDGIAVVDVQGRHVEINDSYCALMGRSRAELLASVIQDFGVDATPAVLATVEAQLAADGVATFDQHVRWPDGSLHAVEVTVTPLRVGQRLAIVRTMDERIKAQKQIEDTLQLLKLAADAAKIGVWNWEFADNQLYWDDRMHEIYQAPEDTLQRGLDYDFWQRHVHPDDRASVETALMASRSSGEPWQQIFRIVLPDGRTRYIQAAAATEYDGEGQPVRMVGINRDITEQRQQEEELRGAKEAADAANAAKSEYLALINHELRTPLNVILGLTQLLQGDPAAVQRHGEELATVVQSGMHMLALINEVLDMAKIEAGKAELQQRDFDLQALVRTIHAMLQPKMDAKRLAFRVELGQTIPHHIQGDEGKLRQVLINLLNNAANFTQVGTVTLRVWCDEMRRLHMSVADTGPGIAPEQMAGLFQPFSRADVGQQQEGTGLGLYISATYVRLMGGEITVSSVLGEGATFMFDISCQAALNAGAARPGTGQAVVSPAIPELLRVKGVSQLRILIVEDVAANRYLLRKILQPLGCALREAEDGVTALAIWEEWQPQVVCLDMMLPEMDGFAVVRALRKREAVLQAASFRAVPAEDRLQEEPGGQRRTLVVATTGLVLLHQQQTMLESGCDAVLTKPFSQEQLFALLQKQLGADFAAVELDPVDSPTRPVSGGPQATDTPYILVVDDHGMNRTVAVGLLERLGHRAEAVADGLEALEALRQRSYALVLLDLQMPGMSGIETAQRIIAEWGERRPRLVATTGGTTEEEQRAWRAAGMDGGIAKPLHLAELRATVGEMLEGWPHQP